MAKRYIVEDILERLFLQRGQKLGRASKVWVNDINEATPFKEAHHAKACAGSIKYEGEKGKRVRKLVLPDNYVIREVRLSMEIVKKEYVVKRKSTGQYLQRGEKPGLEYCNYTGDIRFATKFKRTFHAKRFAGTIGPVIREGYRLRGAILDPDHQIFEFDPLRRTETLVE